MHYIVYKITNILNNKIYIGYHQTDNINDGYMGSGSDLRRAQKKYGMENFRKEILHTFSNFNDMVEMEATLVTAEFVLREDTYNLKRGGSGGWNEEDSNTASKLGVSAMQKLMKDPVWYANWLEKKQAGYRNMSYTARKSQATKAYNTKIKNGYDFSTFKGRTHTKKTRDQMSKSHMGKHDGKKNSQYGTCWIYNLELRQNKKIKNDDLNFWIEKGYQKGCTLDFDSHIKKLQLKHDKKLQKKLQKDNEQEKRRIFFTSLYEEFKLRKLSLRKFCSAGYYDKSWSSLNHNFKKYIK